VEQLGRKTYDTTCPNRPRLSVSDSFSTTFNRFSATEYQLVVTDYSGQETVRTFVVTPLQNMAPEIRITAPAPDQFIVAGAFNLSIGVAYTDDRAVAPASVELYMNDVLLRRSSEGESGGLAVIEQAFASMYDSIATRYSQAMAATYGHRLAPHAATRAYVVDIPPGLVRVNEVVRLSAVLRDVDGVIGRHDVQFQAAPDEIRPEIAILEPQLGFGAREATDFTVRSRARTSGSRSARRSASCAASRPATSSPPARSTSIRQFSRTWCTSIVSPTSSRASRVSWSRARSSTTSGCASRPATAPATAAAKRCSRSRSTRTSGR
jgi:hypothetical protein